MPVWSREAKSWRARTRACTPQVGGAPGAAGAFPESPPGWSPPASHGMGMGGMPVDRLGGFGGGSPGAFGGGGFASPGFSPPPGQGLGALGTIGGPGALGAAGPRSQTAPAMAGRGGNGSRKAGATLLMLNTGAEEMGKMLDADEVGWVEEASPS